MADESFAPPLLDQPFLVRRVEIQWLERSVREAEYGPSLPILVTGTAGIGKTALVVAFVRNYAPRHETFWIRCREFNKLAAAFDQAMRSNSRSARSFPDALVVLDGADEIPEADFKSVLSHVLNFKRVRAVIITSRVDFELRSKKVLPLAGLSLDDAKALIEMGNTNLDIDLRPASLLKLLGMMEGNPAAISLLAKMAGRLDSEQFQRVIDGDLYHVPQSDAKKDSQLIVAATPVIISASEAMVKALQKQPADVYKLHPREFEELTAELLRDMGHEVKLTKRTRDGGVDIFVYIATKWNPMLCLVDTKLYRRERTIGVEMVRTLYGTLCDYQANSAMLATTTTFSREARDFEQKHKYQLALQDYTAMATWIQEYRTKPKP